MSGVEKLSGFMKQLESQSEGNGMTEENTKRWGAQRLTGANSNRSVLARTDGKLLKSLLWKGMRLYFFIQTLTSSAVWTEVHRDQHENGGYYSLLSLKLSIQAYLVLLCFTLLYFIDIASFYKLKVRPSTGEKICNSLKVQMRACFSSIFN